MISQISEDIGKCKHFNGSNYAEFPSYLKKINVEDVHVGS